MLTSGDRDGSLGATASKTASSIVLGSAVGRPKLLANSLLFDQDLPIELLGRSLLFCALDDPCPPLLLPRSALFHPLPADPDAESVTDPALLLVDMDVLGRGGRRESAVARACSPPTEEREGRRNVEGRFLEKGDELRGGGAVEVAYLSDSN